MSVQRWSHEHPTECVPVRYEHGTWVKYEDHERLMAERATLMGAAIESAIEQARTDAIHECIGVLERLDKYLIARIDVTEAVARLRALLPEGER